MKPCIIGWSHSQFGKLKDIELETLVGSVAKAALEDAEVEPREVDAIYVGHFNAGFVPQDFTASLVALSIPELRHTPATRVENACATGSAAIYSAINALLSGQAKTALVVGVEKMNTLPTSEVGKVLLSCSYVKQESGNPMGFAGVFGNIAAEYFKRFGDQSDALATIAAKNHKNGVSNPYAQMRVDLGFDFCRNPSDKNPILAGPLKRTDCSLISDGAAALVITPEDIAKTKRRAVRFRAFSQVNDYLPLSKRDPTRFEGAAQAWQQSLTKAGLRLHDLSLVETHDCFTIAELLEYEAMGLAPHGQGARVLKEGITQKNGKLPVNPSGGLKSKGHPIGATGTSLHVLAAMQVVNEAQDMQIPNAEVAGVFNMGGAAVANYCSILERAA
jgi:acetyl-CoA C-acetyltransferase